MTVRVYRNLNATSDNERWGIMNFDYGDDDYGRVIDHSDRVSLTDVEFVVQPSGYEKHQETGVKNVHAFAEGELFSTDAYFNKTQLNEATYRPDEMDSFYFKDSKIPIKETPLAYFHDGLFVASKQPKTIDETITIGPVNQ